jgi:hypothetical protein
MTTHTLQDYESAKAGLESLNAKWENYSGNNPDNCRASIQDAQARVSEITSVLKAAGTLPRTANEERDHQLELVFPNTKPREVVFSQGKKYVRRFTPAAKRLSGKSVKAWSKTWAPVGEQSDAIDLILSHLS